MRRVILSIGLMAVMLALAGCDTAEQETAAAVDEASADGGSPAQHNSQSTGSKDEDQWKSVSTKTLFPPSPDQGVYVYTAGPDKGTRVTYQVQKQGQSADGTRYVFALKDRLDQYFLRDKQGRLRIRRVDNYVRNVRVTFDPAIIVLPAKLAPGTSGKQEVDMTVRDLESGDVKDSGTCTATFGEVSRRRVRTPAGQFKVYLVHLRRQMDMSMANVDMRIQNAYAPKVGLVLSESRRQTNMVGLINRSHHQRYERAESSSKSR